LGDEPLRRQDKKSKFFQYFSLVCVIGIRTASKRIAI